MNEQLQRPPAEQTRTGRSTPRPAASQRAAIRADLPLRLLAIDPVRLFPTALFVAATLATAALLAAAGNGQAALALLLIAVVAAAAEAGSRFASALAVPAEPESSDWSPPRESAARSTSDPLTGLPDRAAFVGRCDEALARSAQSGAALAVLVVALDDFDRVNARHGREVGDLLLLLTAFRLRDEVGANDTLAHVGGAEFAVLVEGLAVPGAADLIALRLARLLDAPFDLLGRRVAVTARVGVATDRSPDRSRDGAALLRLAEAALADTDLQRAADLAAPDPLSPPTPIRLLPPPPTGRRPGADETRDSLLVGDGRPQHYSTLAFRPRTSLFPGPNPSRSQSTSSEATTIPAPA